MATAPAEAPKPAATAPAPKPGADFTSKMKGLVTEPAPEPAKAPASDPVPAPSPALAPAPAATPEPKSGEKPVVPAGSEEELPPVVAKSPKASEEFRKQKSGYETRISELQKELDTLKGQGEATAEVSMLKKEVDDLRTTLREVSVEKDPEFNRPFESAVARNVDLLKAVLPQDKIASVLGIILAPPSRQKAQALEEVMEGMTDYEKSKIQAVDTQIESVMLDRNAKIKELSTNQAAALVAKRQVEERHFTSALEEMEASTTLKPFLFKPDGSKAESYGEVVSLARELSASNLDPDSRSRSALWAALAPSITRGYMAQAKVISELQKEVARLQGTTPKPGTIAPGGTDDKKADTFEARIQQLMPS